MVPLCGVPIIRIKIYVLWGPPIRGNDHMTAVAYRAKVREAESPDWDGPLARNIMHQSKWRQQTQSERRTFM